MTGDLLFCALHVPTGQSQALLLRCWPGVSLVVFRDYPSKTAFFALAASLCDFCPSCACAHSLHKSPFSCRRKNPCFLDCCGDMPRPSFSFGRKRKNLPFYRQTKPITYCLMRSELKATRRGGFHS